MAKKPYDEVGVVRIISSNKGCTIQGKNITVDDSKPTVGNATWGKIDYLVKVHGYSVTVGKVEKHYNNKPKGPVKEKYQGNNKITDMNILGKQSIDKSSVKSTLMSDITRKAMKSATA